MRGDQNNEGEIFSYVMPEERIPQASSASVDQEGGRRNLEGALCAVRRAVCFLGPALYSSGTAARALLMQVVYPIRSERMLIEQLDYNILFRWFVGLTMDEMVWNHSTFSKNRDRLMHREIAGAFFAKLRDRAKYTKLVSDEHFTVDETLVQAWASLKSFAPCEDGGEPRDQSGAGGKNEAVSFHGERRSNETHVSRTDPDARLYRKGRGKEAKLSYMGHVLMDNRNGLVVDTRLTVAHGISERAAALEDALIARGIDPNDNELVVRSDNGLVFGSKAFIQVSRRFNVTQEYITPYTPERNGMIKRFFRTAKEELLWQ